MDIALCPIKLDRPQNRGQEKRNTLREYLHVPKAWVGKRKT